MTDHRFDLAWSLLLAEAFWSAETRTAILDRYQAAGMVDDLPFFEAGAALKRIWTVVLAIKHGPGTLGMRPEAAERIRESAGHLETVRERWIKSTETSMPAIEELLTSLSPGQV